MIRDSQAPLEVQLVNSANFEGCDFGAADPAFLFGSGMNDIGNAVGSTNRWNRQGVQFNATNVEIRYESIALIDLSTAVTVDLLGQSEWEGNEILIRHVATGTPNVTVKSGLTTVGTISTEGARLVLIRADSMWYANSFAT